jgi:hypothetical protein
MKTLICETPSQNIAGTFRAIVFDHDDTVLEIAEASNFTAAADLAFELHPDAQLSDEALEQVMAEGMDA